MRTKMWLVGAVLLVVSLTLAGCSNCPIHRALMGGSDDTPSQSEIAQKNCPVMGKPIDTDVYIDHEGRRVYFCCDGCVGAFKKDPAKYIAKLDAAQ